MSFFSRSAITATAELLVLRSVKFWTDWWHLLQVYRVWHFGVLNIYRECHYDTKYKGYVQILVPVYHKKYWWKSIGIAIGNTFFTRYCYWYWQYFLKQVLVLVLPILSKSIVNNPGKINSSYNKSYSNNSPKVTFAVLRPTWNNFRKTGRLNKNQKYQ